MTKQQQRDFIFEKYAGHCAFCGCALKKGWHVSPIEQPQTAVGADGKLKKLNDEIENKLPSCSACGLSRIQHSVNGKIMSVESFRKSLTFGFNCMKLNPYYKKAIRYGLIKETGRPVTFYFEQLKKQKS